MGITIYNSLTRKKEPLTPAEDNVLRMYSCGVTVYDRCHIGHGRSLYIFDVIRKYFKYRGYDLRFVRNITDVDDKIINKAAQLGKSAKEVAEDNIKLYYEDLAALGIDKADSEPKATDNIPGMIEHIKGLLEKGIAYVAEGDVYFSVRKFPEYGKLSGQGIEKMLEAVRIEKDLKKQDPLDFALWKRSAENEPYWESPWGRGRPGWHIECSVMSLKHLNCETLDIHAGGRDLIFPHHENEVAQAEALTGKPFARYWIHHGLLTINGQKMAKSAGNFITIQDALKKYKSDYLKMFYLSSHYRSEIDFSEANLEEAKKKWERIHLLMVDLNRMNLASGGSAETAEFRRAFEEAMDDDFNTPKALAVLFDLVHWCRKLMESDPVGKQFMLRAAMDYMHEITGVFGLNFIAEDELNDREQVLLDQRKQARQNKDFKKSDEIRDKLLSLGIVVQDTPAGQTWRRK